MLITQNGSALPTHPILGIDYCVSDATTVARGLVNMAYKGQYGSVNVSAVHLCMECQDDEKLLNGVNSGIATVPDGRPLVWILRMRGQSTARQIRGMDLTHEILTAASESNLPVAFFGARENVLRRFISVVQSEYPKLKIPFYRNGYQSLDPESVDTELVKSINTSGAKIVFVGLGCPRQERWMLTHGNQINAILVGVGAAFDYIAGEISIPPKWISQIGLEWFYRLVQEPHRLWRRYLITNFGFIWKIISTRKRKPSLHP